MEKWCPPIKDNNYDINDELENVNKILNDQHDKQNSIYRYQLKIIGEIKTYIPIRKLFYKNEGIVIIKNEKQEIVDYNSKDKDNKVLEIDYQNKYDINFGSDILEDEDLRKLYLEFIVNILYLLNDVELIKFNTYDDKKKLAYLYLQSRNYYTMLREKLSDDEKKLLKQSLDDEDDVIEKFNNYLEKFSNRPKKQKSGCFSNWKTCVPGDRCSVCPFKFIPLIGDNVCLPCIFEEKSDLFNGMIYVGILVAILIIIFIIYINIIK